MVQIYIKQIIPNLYISGNIELTNDDNLFEEYIKSNNIKNIISINNFIETDNNDDFKVLNININYNDLLIKSNKLITIDFNSTNNFIENSYKNNQIILINSNNIILSAFIAIGFIIKNLNITLFETIYYIFKSINIDIKQVPTNYIHTLFAYYKTLTN